MTNPYAPPQAVVRDIADPSELTSQADRGTRLGATIIDSLIFAATVYLPGIVAGFAVAAAKSGPSNATGIAAIAAMLVGFTVWCWFTIMYMSRNGQSIAKKLLHIKVVRVDGSSVSLGRLIWLRNVVNGLISFIPFYSVVDVLFIFGESRQCLHDRIAGTIVVRA
jgi:uncharacterized RDD family membrane protein YckC